MTKPDYEAACAHGLQRLENELDPRLVYHSLGHTRDIVLVEVVRMAEMRGMKTTELHLLRTAAVFHDIGFLKQRDEHETVSIQIMRATLPDFGYSPAQIDTIAQAIQATRLPQTPTEPLGELLADADLAILGFEPFLKYNLPLREEWANFGRVITDQEWYSQQLGFLQGHRFFTSEARQLYRAQKQRNIALLRHYLEESA